MTVVRVRGRGQLTLPKQIRRSAGVNQGDVVTLEVTGPGTIELKVLPRMSLAETFDRWRIEGPIDWAKDRAEWEAAAADDLIEKAAQNLLG